MLSLILFLVVHICYFKLAALLMIITLSYIGSKESSISQVIVTPCPAEPCQLKKGVNESIEVIFKPGKN